MKKKFVLICIFVSAVYANDLVDLVCFSYDRGLQLYSFLESAELRITGLNKTHVIYRSSRDQFDTPYRDMADNKFKNVDWIKQGNNPSHDFKPLLMETLCKSEADYILFAVDDIIVKDDVNIADCVNALKETGAYAFYLRLGKNITYCYAERKKSPVPPLRPLVNDMYEWCFAQGSGDWGYPNSVDLTLFRKDQLIHDIKNFDFSNPNYLESCWAQKASKQWYGLCFGISKMINIPMNTVQRDFKRNPNMRLFTKEQMLKVYNDGYKFDIQKLYKIQNNSAHFEIVPELIKR